jgi:hypothetical protein
MTVTRVNVMIKASSILLLHPLTNPGKLLCPIQDYGLLEYDAMYIV